MPAASIVPQPRKTMADLRKQLGNIPALRILLDPPPGTATRRDLIRLMDHEPKQLCELVDKTLVEKAKCNYESRKSIDLGISLGLYLREQDLGFLTGESGGYRIGSSVLIPDIAFISWRHFASREESSKYAIMPFPPDLAVEIVSKGNTEKEIRKKVKAYLKAGVKLVWVIDPKQKLAMVHRADGSSEVLKRNDQLSGEDVLPGLKIPVRVAVG